MTSPGASHSPVRASYHFWVPGRGDLTGLLFVDEGGLEDCVADHELVVEFLVSGFGVVVEDGAEDGVAGFFLLDEEVVDVDSDDVADNTSDNGVDGGLSNRRDI